MSTEILGSDQVFSESERRIIAAIAEATIGQDQSRKLPAASDPQVLATILEKAANFRVRLKEGIEIIGSEIEVLDTASEQILDQLERNPRLRSFSRILTIVIMQSYYQDPRVLDSLGLASRPPFPLGHEVPEGDWSLLDTVKKRAPFYRQV
ncbi:MAG: hypothetical protein ACJAVI_006020 [Candidatus Azotimanducaceae bacterium]|jgi:hypothetical protein